jgi:hypothetical protein
MNLDFFSRLRGTEFVSIWYPPPEIDEKELVGRRLLDRASKERPKNEEGCPLCDINDFYDTRLEDDLSIDRLGNPNPTLDTLREITKLADQEAGRPGSNRVFIGWATIRVQLLRFPGWDGKVIASPTRHEDRTVENHWHADIKRDVFREKAHAYALAATLQQTFMRKGGYQAPNRSHASSPATATQASNGGTEGIIGQGATGL